MSALPPQASRRRELAQSLVALAMKLVQACRFGGIWSQNIHSEPGKLGPTGIVLHLETNLGYCKYDPPDMHSGRKPFRVLPAPMMRAVAKARSVRYTAVLPTRRFSLL